MNSAQQWVQEAEAAELLAISKSTIRAMRRDGRLEPGDHYLFASGTAGGPVVYNIPAVIQHLAQVTTAEIETSSCTWGGSQMNPARARRAADLIWAASLELEPNLAPEDRVDVTILAMERLLPDDCPLSLASAAIGSTSIREAS